MIFTADLIACSTCFGQHCPSSGAREYYTGGCCLWYLVLWFSSCRYGVELRVMCPVCGLCGLLLANRTHNTQLHTIPTTWKPKHQIPQAATTLELLMMGIVVPETCWASNKTCNKNHLLHLVGILFPHINSTFFTLCALVGIITWLISLMHGCNREDCYTVVFIEN
jgi:hypothetical protein